MNELWAVLGALATVVLPLVLAWWLLGRPAQVDSSQGDRCGKISRKEGR